MTKEPQEEINRLMNEKLNADKMSLNPPLKFEPQEEWEEDVKKFCKKYGWSEEELYKEPMHTYSDLCMKEMDDDFKKLEDADFRHENYIQQFIQKHIVSAYNYGYKAGEEEAVKEFLKPKGMPNFHKAVETLRNKQIQQAITETEKAFGGCKKCYGKGYSTEHIGKTTAFGDFEGERDYIVSNPHIKIRYCSCERGKALQELQNK